MIVPKVHLFGVLGSWLLIVVIIFDKPASAELATFDYCIKANPSVGLLQCAGQQALASLQFLEEASNLTLTSGLQIIKDESNPSARILPNFVDHDPLDFRGILENAGAMISQRQLLWDMGIIYPGLKLKLGPSLGAAGVLEFVLDPSTRNGERSYFEEKSTARILTRNFIVPFLLGLKFNLATLLPLVFGGLILLSKKALILGKIALFVSGLFGYGSLYTPGIGYGFASPGLGAGFGGFPYKPYRYSDALSDKPDWSGQHQHYQHSPPSHQSDGGYHHHESHLQSDDSTGGGYTSFGKKTDKFLNLDERLEPQASSMVDKFYEFEKQQMMNDRTSRLFERKFYEANQEKLGDGGGGASGNAPSSSELPKGDGYTFVTATATDSGDRNGRSLPMDGGYRNFAWSEA
ncbi:uncharacterized protein LOC131425767 [Malaya genurostris]|uniref:uncharacterized protein LOC131425767 n=1 Tax=Malaya genurostris TaxID=325434 RepID=UPI0026F3CB87|nr:uncharacterized protein LOC131425767 [Malaya genurostris]